MDRVRPPVASSPAPDPNRLCSCQNGHTDVVKLLLTYPNPSRTRPNTEAQESNSKATALCMSKAQQFCCIGF
jgi:hypothetical protein